MSNSDYRWGVFVGGMVLGSTMAAGTAYLFLKYGPALINDAGASKPGAKKRVTRCRYAYASLLRILRSHSLHDAFPGDLQ
jgi:hypothetical protein